MNWIRALIDRNPRLSNAIGKCVFLAGAILVLCAVFARVGLIAANADRANAKLPAVRTLAEAFPQYPTWIVPEGPFGFAVAAVLVLAGMALVTQAAGRGRRP
jgi:hypothetical protein